MLLWIAHLQWTQRIKILTSSKPNYQSRDYNTATYFGARKTCMENTHSLKDAIEKAPFLQAPTLIKIQHEYKVPRTSSGQLPVSSTIKKID